MTTPSTPNFNPLTNPGHLVTDRYDFEKHYDGYAFRHNSTQIDLYPTLVINSTTTTTVQQALTQLSLITSPPSIPDATTSSKGIVELTGDISGVATHVVVTGLQNKPVSTLAPSSGNVLSWVGGAWTPTALPTLFSAGGDLAGNNVYQTVVGLSGTSNIITISGNNLNFISSSTASITQDINSVGVGKNMNITAQGSSLSGNNGGDVIISGGLSGGSGGLRGGVQLDLATLPMVQVTEPIVNQRVLSLLKGSAITSGNMPAGTGDMVMYIADAAVAPSSGNPSGGTIMYSQGGQLYVKQGDGNNFLVGSIPNPSIWGNSGQQTYTQRSYVTSTTSSPVTAFNFPLPDNTSTKIDVIFVGKQSGVNESAQFNLTVGYTRTSGSAPLIVGTLTSADPRTTSGAVGWTAPTITISTNNVLIQTGCALGTQINWLVITQLTMSAG
jgi:hypothetical protein